jgi:hypothetical protein
MIPNAAGSAPYLCHTQAPRAPTRLRTRPQSSGGPLHHMIRMLARQSSPSTPPSGTTSNICATEEALLGSQGPTSCSGGGHYSLPGQTGGNGTPCPCDMTSLMRQHCRHWVQAGNHGGERSTISRDSNCSNNGSFLESNLAAGTLPSTSFDKMLKQSHVAPSRQYSFNRGQYIRVHLLRFAPTDNLHARY